MDMLAFVPSVAFLGGFLVFLFSLLNARCRWRAFCSDAACFAGESMFEAGPVALVRCLYVGAPLRYSLKKVVEILVVIAFCEVKVAQSNRLVGQQELAAFFGGVLLCGCSQFLCVCSLSQVPRSLSRYLRRNLVAGLLFIRAPSMYRLKIHRLKRLEFIDL
jgi:hypothetical protein